MQINISAMRESDRADWDKFVSNHKDGCVYQLSAWKDVVALSYSHDINYSIATKIPIVPTISMTKNPEVSNENNFKSIDNNSVVGMLPLVHIGHKLFGNSLVSMPFCDMGGVLAKETIVERMLVEHGLRTAEALHVPVVELRQSQFLSWMDNNDFIGEVLPSGQREIRAVPGWRVMTVTDGKKVRMLLDLPESPDALLRSFKAKLRSQIRRPMKEGLDVKIGGVNMLDEFYNIFVTNMRDLGSPVHSKRFILQILLNFSDKARIFIVYKQGTPLACSMTLGFNDILSNPWASSLRRYSRFAPNMLLYWAMLEYACQQGYRRFDFGRSSVAEGTYRFKEQWGAKPIPLYWYRFVRDNHSTITMNAEKNSMSWAIACWKHLPIPVTRVLGPMVRRYISL